MSNSEQQTCAESDTDAYDSDDSQQDPTFDVLAETRSSFSRLSINKKSKPRIAKEVDDEDMEVEEDVVQMVVPELDEKDQKSYETIEKLIKAGQVEKLKVDQCKVYLRKHGLRLTGNKDTLIQRIKEHLDIIDGGGERKYPASSFLLNCKGDACTGDIVMFEQNVYEMFSIASRSATGPPCGTRIVAGRIVKESYGAAKQQHTFTIEVLWSKGEKPLPPLHPLLIKGRNLYRLKTLRQRWEDEGERHKILSEKHARGAAARSNREARVQQKEIRKMQKSNRASRTKDQYSKQENRREMPHCPSTTSETVVNHLQLQEDTNKNQQEPDRKLKQSLYSGPCQDNSLAPPDAVKSRPSVFLNAHIPSEMIHQQRQPLMNMSMGSSRIPLRMHIDNQYTSVYPPVQKEFYDARHKKYNAMRSPQRGHGNRESILGAHPSERHIYEESNAIRSPLRGQSYRHNMNSNPLEGSKQGHSFEGALNSNFLRIPMQRPAYHGNAKFSTVGSPVREQHHGRKQPCRFYAQGMCYYGDSCKYLHEYSENHHSH